MVYGSVVQEFESGEWRGDDLADGHVPRRNEPISSKRSRGRDILDIILRMPDVMDTGRR